VFPLPLQNHILGVQHLTTAAGSWIPQYLQGKRRRERGMEKEGEGGREGGMEKEGGREGGKEGMWGRSRKTHNT